MKRITSLSKKKVLALATGTAVVVTAGAAWAYWTANGSGNSQAKALTAQGITVAAPVATLVGELFPGGTASVHFKLTNTNPYPVTFTTMTPGTVVSSDPTNCAASNVTAAGKTGLARNVAANATSVDLSIPAVLTMATSALDGCQGVTFTVPLTLTGSQV